MRLHRLCMGILTSNSMLFPPFPQMCIPSSQCGRICHNMPGAAWTMYPLRLHWLVRIFLCLRTGCAGGIMFSVCPSVRMSVRPDFLVYAITQEVYYGIWSWYIGIIRQGNKLIRFWARYDKGQGSKVKVELWNFTLYAITREIFDRIL